MEAEPYQHPRVAALLSLALDEDLGRDGDCTARALVADDARLRARLLAKEDGVICGLPLFPAVFTGVGGEVECTPRATDGDRIAAGDVLLEAEGRAATILAGERTALNLVQRLSGTATLTRRFVDALADHRARVYDTRKTAPGLRELQKYAVRCGGGVNHRAGLYDQVLIKENHLAFFGGDAAAAVRRCRERLAPTTPIEVEITDPEQVPAAADAGADVILCDNMDPDTLARAVAARGERGCELEASGGITLEGVAAIAATGVERISVGALTHSAPALDLSLLCEPAGS